METFRYDIWLWLLIYAAGFLATGSLMEMYDCMQYYRKNYIHSISKEFPEMPFFSWFGAVWVVWLFMNTRDRY